MKNFKPIEYEILEWNNKENTQYLSRQKKSKILSSYESSLPNMISDIDVQLSSELESQLTDLLINMSRFDSVQNEKGYTFPTVLLRSESAASSQIENLTSSIRNIALAELSEKTPQNAKLIAKNVEAMREALNESNPISILTICEIHKKLMEPLDYAGMIREQAVWIGGTSISPHGAIFVPPHYSHLDNYLNDLVLYAHRIDINPIVKAAIMHAQFETIHPFIDGNGRAGRVLLHKSLKDDNVLQTVALPISAGLLNDTDNYMKALLSYQNGDPTLIIEQVAEALELSLVIGDKVSRDISTVISTWEQLIDEKRSSSIWNLLYLLIDQPVVNSAFVSEKMEITLRGANKLISRAIDYGILRRIGNEHRGIFYQADAIIEIMDSISDLSILKRNKY